MVTVFTRILLISTFANLIMYLCCALAALKLASGGQLGAGRALTSLIVVATLAAAYSAWTLYGAGASALDSSGKEAFWWSIALFVAGVPVYAAMKWRRRREASTAVLAAPELPG
jgi:APA family basic amino acid/polyamine antiporter